MPTVDEEGVRATRPWSSAADQARARADIQQRTLARVKALYDGALDDSIRAHRAARAAMGTADFEALFLRAKGLHVAAQIAEKTWKQAWAAWRDLDRAAARLERERRAS